MSNELDIGGEQQVEELDVRGREQMQLAQRLTVVKFTDKDADVSNSLMETPSKILEREFMIFQSDITIVNNTIKPWELLLELPQVKRALYGFKFFKANVKLRVLINSTPMYYGMLCVSWLPDTARVAPLVEPINADPIVMDISAQDAIEFEIPYISLYDSIKVRTTYTNQVSTPWVNFTTLGYAQGSSEMPTINYNVYASFVKPQAWGAQSIPTVVSQSGGAITIDRRDNFITNFPSFPSETKSSALSLVEKKESVDNKLTMTGIAAYAIPIVGPAISALVSTVKMGLMAYDFAQDAYDRYEGIPKGERQDMPDPVRQNPAAVRQQAYGDMAATVYSPSLSLVSNLPSFYPPYHKGDPGIRHLISDTLRIPTIRHVRSLTGSPPNIQLLYEPFSSFVTANDYMSYMDMIGCLFRYWRGSIKLSIKFYTSPFITATYRLLLFNADGDLDPLAPDPSVYAYKKVVTVRGTTQVDLVIPYLSVVPWQPLQSFTGSPGLNPALPVSRLYLETVTPPNAIGDQTPYVFMMTMVSAGDDFQMKDLRSPTPTNISPVTGVVQSQMRVRTDFHSVSRTNLACGTDKFVKLKDLYEDGMTFEDASMRASIRISDGPIRFALRQDYSFVNLLSTDVFDFVQNMFRYVRGSIKARFQANQPFYDAMMYGMLPQIGVCDTFSRAAGNGFASNYSAQNSIFEFEIPYQCQTEWVPTSLIPPDVVFPIAPNPCIVEVADYSTSHLYVSAGRDYQLAFLLPPRREWIFIPPFACI